ncbi:Gmad2 immunoglobulin-like domain-containing protein [Kyrpidia sp.]|uniref:Gmad2 immunoglobulin-like domain-containing protein n=1 Tax=Kyrpidia sp. TaxID=2073077 RepID=UPI002582662A|nr:Gmad2 immunoglobulin-like domain-containing protein [Kyrpidia sp.]MCL6577284.1 protease complex subunit PrcB family protein [Kyrpidia sp.]
MASGGVWRRGMTAMAGVVSAALVLSACGAAAPSAPGQGGGASVPEGAGDTASASDGQKGATATNPNDANGSQVKKLAVRHVAEGDYPAAEMGDWVRANRERPFWGFFTFGRTRYLMVSRGPSPNPGYTVEVQEIKQLPSGHLQVRAVFRDPEPGKLYAQVISYPVDVVETPASATAYELIFEGPRAPKSPGLVEPNIMVTAPKPEHTLTGTSLHLQGKARAFEGQIHVYLEDGHNVLLDQVLSGAGAPEWMTIDKNFAYKAPTNPAGMLMVYAASPRDGSKQDVVMVPVRFQR